MSGITSLEKGTAAVSRLELAIFAYYIYNMLLKVSQSSIAIYNDIFNFWRKLLKVLFISC